MCAYELKSTNIFLRNLEVSFDFINAHGRMDGWMDGWMDGCLAGWLAT